MLVMVSQLAMDSSSGRIIPARLAVPGPYRVWCWCERRLGSDSSGASEKFTSTQATIARTKDIPRMDSDSAEDKKNTDTAANAASNPAAPLSICQDERLICVNSFAHRKPVRLRQSTLLE